jgi:hypothetical protein
MIEVFVRDIVNNTTSRVAILGNMSEPNGSSYNPQISSD